MNRRGFFSSFSKSLTKGKSNLGQIYLPYIKDISLVGIVCKECDKPCIDICKTGIIAIKDDVPVLNVKDNGCIFCKECAKACSSIDKNVLDEKLVDKIYALVTIKTLGCLSWNNTMCYTCKDVCEFNAISFFGTFRPTINKDVCTGCGVCISACPTSAIEIYSTI